AAARETLNSQTNDADVGALAAAVPCGHVQGTVPRTWLVRPLAHEAPRPRRQLGSSIRSGAKPLLVAAKVGGRGACSWRSAGPGRGPARSRSETCPGDSPRVRSVS